MMDYIVKILSIEPVTHDVKRFRIQKPADYTFNPGQATDVSVNKAGMESEKRPFTFTCLQTENFLEFTIKRYADHKGVTDLLHQLVPGDELIIRDVWGAIEYKGPGYFIAGGAGITPFLAILRQLHTENKLVGNTLIFSNKTKDDIICENELKSMLGEHALFLLTKENRSGYLTGYLNQDFIREHIPGLSGHFYICGPDKMISDISGMLSGMGASPDAVIFEK